MDGSSGMPSMFYRLDKKISTSPATRFTPCSFQIWKSSSIAHPKSSETDHSSYETLFGRSNMCGLTWHSSTDGKSVPNIILPAQEEFSKKEIKLQNLVAISIDTYHVITPPRSWNHLPYTQLEHPFGGIPVCSWCLIDAPWEHQSSRLSHQRSVKKLDSLPSIQQRELDPSCNRARMTSWFLHTQTLLPQCPWQNDDIDRHQ